MAIFVDAATLPLVAPETRPMPGQIDHVTSLPNRRRFIADLPLQPGGASRVLVLLTLADAKHFNEILRALGHEFADHMVRAGAERIAHLLPAGCTLYHVSVLSFAFVTVTTSAEEAARAPAVVNTLVQSFRRPLLCDDLPIVTRVGIGVLALPALINTPAENLRAVLAAAQDSRRGPQGWAFYNRNTDEAHQRAFQLLSDLRQALLHDTELSLAYQPRIDLRSGRAEGAEVLIRWAHPALGSIPPSEFIALAEATGLMVPLTDWILTAVLRHMRAWPPAWDRLKVSVNISPSSLHQANFAERLGTLMSAFMVTPDRLELEFTEGTLTSSDAAVTDQITQILALGMTVAIDDFGTGYSNLDYLTRLSAQVLKIDQGFIRTMDQDPRRAILTRAIIDLAHKLGYRVVAEGIETHKILDMLKACDCDEGQGYFFARPMPEAQFRDWLKSNLDGAPPGELSA